MPVNLDYRQRDYFAPSQNPIGRVRLPALNRNTFQPMGIPEPVETQEVPSDPREDMFSSLMSMQGRKRPAMDAYKQYISEMPRYEDYKPGLKNKFGAALAGLSEGLIGDRSKVGDRVRSSLDEPYNRNMALYQQRGQGIGQLAEIEANDQSQNLDFYQKLIESMRKDKESEADIAYKRRQTETTGMEVVENPLDGTRGLLDKGKGTINNLGKVNLTPYERGNLDVDVEGRKEGNRQIGRVNLENTRQSGMNTRQNSLFGQQNTLQKNLFGQQNTLQKQGAQNTRDNWDHRVANPTVSQGAYSAGAQKTANDLARNNVLDKYPHFRAILDDKGNIKADQNNTFLHQAFVKSVEAEEAKIRQNMRPGLTVNSPVSSRPNADEALRQQAINELITLGITDYTPEDVEDAMEQLRGQ